LKATLFTLRRLATAIDYLRIKHSAKHRYDWSLPITISILLMLIYYFLPIKPSILKPGGIISQINSIIQILTGFYIASLAAVATFNSDRLNKTMNGREPASIGEENLTRRRFLCLLFSYLVTLCFILMVVGISAPIISQNVKLLLPNYFLIIKYTALSAYTFMVSQLVVITLLGLYYIADKIHDKTIRKNKTIRALPPEEVEDEDEEYKAI